MEEEPPLAEEDDDDEHLGYLCRLRCFTHMSLYSYWFCIRFCQGLFCMNARGTTWEPLCRASVQLVYFC